MKEFLCSKELRKLERTALWCFIFIHCIFMLGVVVFNLSINGADVAYEVVLAIIASIIFACLYTALSSIKYRQDNASFMVDINSPILILKKRINKYAFFDTVDCSNLDGDYDTCEDFTKCAYKPVDIIYIGNAAYNRYLTIIRYINGDGIRKIAGDNIASIDPNAVNVLEAFNSIVETDSSYGYITMDQSYYLNKILSEGLHFTDGKHSFQVDVYTMCGWLGDYCHMDGVLLEPWNIMNCFDDTIDCGGSK